MLELKDYKDLRAVYCDTLIELAGEYPEVVMMEADLMAAAGTAPFKKAFPDRHINVGVAEANMVGLAGGLSAAGFVPFANTFGCFATRRAYDQFFLSVNYAKRNVKLVGLDPGVTAAFNGGTHMPFEDTALACAVPGLTVIESSDTVTTYKLLKEAFKLPTPVYIRLHRKGAATRYPLDQVVEIGKGIIAQEGDEIAIMASGMLMMEESLKAAAILQEKGHSVAVIDMHTVKPLDKELVLKYAKKCKLLVTCENGRSSGGLGSAVAELLADECPTSLIRVGVEDEFGEVGTLEYLKKRFGLRAEDIVQRVEIGVAKQAACCCS